MANHPNRSRRDEFAIVVLRSDIPQGAMGHADGIRAAGNNLLTFPSVEAARAYLPTYVAWVRNGYARDKNWARYNRRVKNEVFLVVKAEDVPIFGIISPPYAAARYLHSEI